MLSNGRCIGSAGRLSVADMENAYSGMQQQWTDKTGVLPAAWDLREKLLLLAPETPQSDGRSCRYFFRSTFRWQKLPGLRSCSWNLL